jgi:hypothetical protein
MKPTFLNLILTFFISLNVNCQEIVINEYFNAASQNDEWTELVVVKDSLSLVGYFLGDNNATTSTWQPKIRFKDIPLWRNLRSGTIIIIDHASNSGNCNEASSYDYDNMDGFIRLCSKNSNYFEGGIEFTLFLASQADFIHIINPVGKMVHGIGHGENPGTSIVGGNCFTSTSAWTNTTATQSATRPCSNFLFYKFGMSAPASLKVVTGTLSNFSAGIQTTTNNGFIDTTDTPFEGIGNGGANDIWLKELRTPEIDSQKVNLNRSGSLVSFSWLPVSDLFPSDNTVGYMVVRNSTETFTNPQNGREYALNSLIGTGTVVGLINNSGTVTFSESPGSGNFFYRVYAFRYKNTTPLDHPTRGRTYNTTHFVSVSEITSTRNEIISELDIRVFPNPSNGEINLNCEKVQGNSVLIRIYDVNGKTIKEENHQIVESKLNCKIHFKPQFEGIYNLEISNEKQRFSKRIILSNSFN